MALDIGKTTQGVSADGLETLYNDIHTNYVEKAIEVLQPNSQSFTTVKSTIGEAWVGPDEEKFIENFETLLSQTVTALKGYDEALKGEFQKVYDQWSTFQAGNVK